MKIQGQVCYVTPNSIYAIKGKQRLKDNCQHMEIISNVSNNINPYAKIYKNLHQLTKNKELSEYCLYFTRNINLNKSRYNSLSTAECAALTVSKDGDIPTFFDLCVYPKFREPYGAASVAPM